MNSVDVRGAGRRGAVVVVCDHASNVVPPDYGGLGLDAVDLERHIAWDPGALGVAERLAHELDAPLVATTVSRLVIDVNRALDEPSLIAATSEDTQIPGNAALTAAQRAGRVTRFHEPYHASIESLLDRRGTAGLATALVDIHSFTPTYCGVARPWDIGVLSHRDHRLGDPLTRALEGERADPLGRPLVVGRNEPYRPSEGTFYTMLRHGEARGLPCVMVEIRNDHLSTIAGQRAWADLLARLLTPLLGRLS